MFSCRLCNSDLVLRLARKGERSGEYFWGCESYPACYYMKNSYVKAHPGDDYPVKILDDWQEILFSDALKDESYIKIAMPMILEHFIGCTLGRCCTNIYQRFILPHFDSPKLLQDTLLSGIINQDRGNVITSESGIPIFYELFKILYTVKSVAIRRYLEQEFPSYAEQWLENPYRSGFIED